MFVCPQRQERSSRAEAEKNNKTEKIAAAREITIYCPMRFLVEEGTVDEKK